MTTLFQEPSDATPLTPVEREGLLQNWIAHREELNEAEQENIVAGSVWARRRASRVELTEILTDDFVKELHRRMFADVWRWAGVYRTTERNLGIAPNLISQRVPQHLDDVRYWIEHATYEPDEIAVRLHHGLVQIHPFPNGNGRHTRLMADLVVERMGGRAFTWGGGELADAGDLRERYIAALRRADQHAIEPLILFART